MSEKSASLAKRRRIESLNAAQEAKAGNRGKKRPLQALDTATGSAAGAPNPGSSIAAEAAKSSNRAGSSASHPYNQLDLSKLPTHLQQQLRLQGAPGRNIQEQLPPIVDLLEGIMQRSMPLPTARSLIAARTRDKQILLDNPTAALSHLQKETRRPKLTAQMWPRTNRQAVAQLPAHIPPEDLRPLTDLWHNYIRNLVGNSADGLKERLPQADWHGSSVEVVSSKAPAYQGLAGVVVKCTANTWVLVGPDGRPRVVPKKGCVFKCSLFNGKDVFMEGDSHLAGSR